MRVLIINLDRSTERLALQQAQMAALGMKFSRFAAIDASTLTDEGSEAYWNRWERPMRRSERACFLSHRAVWQQVAAGTEPVLVLEDDAVLSDKVPALLAQLHHRHDMDHLTLETRGRRKLLRKKADTALPIRRLYLDRSGAAAYVLWPKGAQKLLHRTRNKAAIADAAICATYHLRSFQADPALAVQLDFCQHYNLPMPVHTQSSISDHRKKSSLAFLVRRVHAQIVQGLRQLNHLANGKHLHISVVHQDFAYLNHLDFSSTPAGDNDTLDPVALA